MDAVDALGLRTTNTHKEAKAEQLQSERSYHVVRIYQCFVLLRSLE